MKKKIVLLLSAIMLLHQPGVNVFAANTAEEDTAAAASQTVEESAEESTDDYEEQLMASIRDDIKEETALLTSAGVISLESDFDPTETVTRAEFAAYTAAAIKAENSMSLSYFTDVPMNHWASDSINSLVEIGAINKASDGLFNPDRAITYAEACKIMTVITGYTVYVDPNGDMTQYVTIANSAGFGIVPTEAGKLNRADAIKLVYNSMRVDMMKVSVKGNSYTVKADKDNNLFSVYHNITFDNARLEATFEKRMVNVKLNDGEVLIGGTQYYADASVVPEEYFGREINFAYRTDKKDVDMTVLYAEPKFSDDKIQIMYDDAVSFNDNTRQMVYDVGGETRTKLKTDTASKNVQIVYNGRLYTKELKPRIEEFVKGERKGTIELISSRGNGETDLIVVTSYEIFGKYAYNGLTETFYGKNTTIDIGDYENFIIYDTNHIVHKESELTSGPYMLAATPDKDSLTIIICMVKAEGILESIGDSEVKIGGTVYEADDKFWKENSSRFNIGVAYTVYLDLYGKIVDMTVGGVGGMRTGYVIRAVIPDDTPDEAILLKLYTQDDGTLQWYDLTSKVVIDGKRYRLSNVKDIVAAFPGNSSITGSDVHLDRQVIRYRINEDGKIAEIDTTIVGASEDKSTTLRQTTNGRQKQYYRGGQKSIGMTGYIDSSYAKFLVVPVTNENGEVVVKGNVVEDNEERYANNYALEDWEYLTYELYKYSSDTVASDLVVLYIEPLEPDYNVCMFDEFTKEVDEDGDVVSKLCGFTMGSEAKYTLDDMVDISKLDLNRGDIVRFETSPSGDVVYSVTKMYDVETDGFCSYEGQSGGWATNPDRYWYGSAYAEETSNQWAQKYQLMRGYPQDLQNGVLSISHTLSMAYEGKSSAIFKASGLPVTVYEPSRIKDELYSAQLTDILTYKMVGDNCDYMLISSKDANYKQIFIIKK